MADEPTTDVATVLTEAQALCQQVHPDRWTSALIGSDRACLACLDVTVRAARTTPSLDDLRGAVIRVRFVLARHLEAVCPGPHSYVQHRDRRSPWCRACGRNRDGDPCGEYPPSATEDGEAVDHG